MERFYDQLSNKYVVKYNGRTFSVSVVANYDNDKPQYQLVLKCDLWLHSYIVREEDDMPLTLQFEICFDSAQTLEKYFDEILYGDENIRDLVTRVLFMPVAKNPRWLTTIKGECDKEMRHYK